MKVISFAIKKLSILEEANKNITKYVKNYSQGINKVPIKNKLKKKRINRRENSGKVLHKVWLWNGLEWWLGIGSWEEIQWYVTGRRKNPKAWRHENQSICSRWDFQVALVVKNPPANSRRHERCGFILGQEDPLEEVPQTTPIFLPGKSMDRRVWQAAVHRITQSWTGMKQLSTHACMFKV